MKRFIGAAAFVLFQLALLAFASAFQPAHAANLIYAVDWEVARGLQKLTMPQAPAKSIDGVVMARVNIDEKGAIVFAKAMSGPNEIAKPFERALMEWRYNSFGYNGQTVQVETTVSIVYDHTLNRYYTQVDNGAVFAPPETIFDVADAVATGDTSDPLGFLAIPVPDSATTMGSVQRVSGGVLGGKARSRPQPVYPAAAREKGVDGEVVVQVLVGHAGLVVCAIPLSGHTLLKSAAVGAARNWTFEPVTFDGKSVNVVGTITFRFRRG